eukprot:1751967-Rhodomonas_salina.1
MDGHFQFVCRPGGRRNVNRSARQRSAFVVCMCSYVCADIGCAFPRSLSSGCSRCTPARGVAS